MDTANYLVASTNTKYLSQFVNAEEWQQIVSSP